MDDYFDFILFSLVLKLVSLLQKLLFNFGLCLLKTIQLSLGNLHSLWNSFSDWREMTMASYILLLGNFLDNLFVLVFVLVDERPDVFVLQPHLFLVSLNLPVQT